MRLFFVTEQERETLIQLNNRLSDSDQNAGYDHAKAGLRAVIDFADYPHLPAKPKPKPAWANC